MSYTKLLKLFTKVVTIEKSLDQVYTKYELLVNLVCNALYCARRRRDLSRANFTVRFKLYIKVVPREIFILNIGLLRVVQFLNLPSVPEKNQVGKLEFFLVMFFADGFFLRK